MFLCILCHSQSVKCSELIGFYVSPEVWCKLVLPAIRTSAGCQVSGTDQASTVAVGPVQCTSCLQVISALVKGAKEDMVKPYMKVGIIKWKFHVFTLDKLLS